MIEKEIDMNTKRIYLLIIIVLMVGFLPQGDVFADMGPKPTMEFEFRLEDIGPDEVLSIKLLECGLSSVCETEYLFEEKFPSDVRQYFGSCDLQECSFSYYDFDEYHRLAVQMSNGVVLKSNVFKNSYFNSRYKVMIQPDSLYVEELRGSNWQIVETIFGVIYELVVYEGLAIPVIGMIFVVLAVIIIYTISQKDGAKKLLIRLINVFLLSLMLSLSIMGLILSWKTFALTLLIECTLAILYFRFMNFPVGRVLYGVCVANIFTQPAFVFLLMQINVGKLHINSISILAVLEIIIWLVEATVIYLLQEKKLSFKRILLPAFLFNAASFGTGLLLPI